VTHARLVTGKCELVHKQHGCEVDKRPWHGGDGNAAEDGAVAVIEVPRSPVRMPSIRRSVGVVTSGAGFGP
jgi:hypothetical protein